jgi:hypothetical protein
VSFVPNWIEHPEPGGVNWTTRTPLSKGKIRIEPPSETPIKRLRALDIRNRDDDDLELEVDPPRSRGLDCSFAAHLITAHVQFLSALTSFFQMETW